MTVLTLGGQAGAGAPEIGSKVARTLGFKYVEHQALRRLARRLNASVEAVTKKELAFASRSDQFFQFLETLFSRYGWYGVDYGMGGAAWPQDTVDLVRDKRRLPGEITKREYIDAIHETAQQFADEGSLLLVKRAGVITLKDRPEIAHVGLFAPMNFRTARVANRMNVGTSEAEEIVTTMEKARAAWFDAIGSADPADPSIYDFTFDISHESHDEEITSTLVEEMKGAVISPLEEEHPELMAVK